MDDKNHHRPAAAVVVAHPDDEVLWAGGTMLARPGWDWTVITLCRARDADRAPRWHEALRCLHARGRIGDLDDGPDQAPLPIQQVQRAIAAGGDALPFDLVLTHGPAGEYTRHRRHEEVCRAVVALWEAQMLTTPQLWMFAYQDGGGRYLPRVRDDADVREHLSGPIWQRKYELMTEVYGFAADSWEARTTPREEGFWRCDSPVQARRRIEQSGG